MARTDLVLAVSLPTTAASPAKARAAVSQAFAGMPDGSLDDAQLLVSEAVTEAVKAAGPNSDEPLHLSGYLAGTTLRIEVAHDGRRSGGPVAGDHLGLEILDAVATRWGHDHEGRASTTWFELDAAAH